MKTAFDPRIIREDESHRGVTVGAKVEVTMNSVGATSMEVGTTQRKSYKSVLEAGVDGERVFALQYCPVRFEKKVRLARDGEVGGFMGVRRVKKARLYGGGGGKVLDQCLSFGPSDGGGSGRALRRRTLSFGPSDGGEGDAGEEEICLGSVLEVDGLDILPF